MIIRPAKSINGTIVVPGDKSISHRAVIIASIADGVSRFENFATGQDCRSTIGCFRQLGVEIEQDGTSIIVHGVGKTGFQKPFEPLECGNSGTTIRLLAGLLAGQNFDSVLTGDESLLKRPMKRIIEPLSRMGAEIGSNDGFAPLRIHGRNSLKTISYEMPVASAQVKSCILLAGLNANGVTSVIEGFRTRDHTERMLKQFGADVSSESEAEGVRISINSNTSLTANDTRIPGDISGAAFFIVAAACLPGSFVSIPNIGLNSTRTAIIGTLSRLGAEIAISDIDDGSGERTGMVDVRGSQSLVPNGDQIIGGSAVANLIDELPILAVFGTQIEGGIEVRGAAELRKKETDRISAVVENLRRMNAEVEEFDDGFLVRKSELKGAVVDSFGDHRIAMAFAVAGLLAVGETTIQDPGCADISFPGFYEQLVSVVQR